MQMKKIEQTPHITRPAPNNELPSRPSQHPHGQAMHPPDHTTTSRRRFLWIDGCIGIQRASNLFKEAHAGLDEGGLDPRVEHGVRPEEGAFITDGDVLIIGCGGEGADVQDTAYI